MAALIKVKDIQKSFLSGISRTDVLKGVNLEMNKGDTVAVVGASGIGKSTFLHILGALDRPDNGNVWFKGKDIFQFDNEKLADFRNQSIGFVFQFHYLLPEFTALENAMMPMLIKGYKKGLAQKTSEEILVRVGLKDRMTHRIVTLSGGEQQRVALARAIVLKPDILLADEPTGNLDKKNSEKIHELLLSLNNEFNMALVIVTHNMELATLMSRRVTIVDGLLVEMN